MKLSFLSSSLSFWHFHLLPVWLFFFPPLLTVSRAGVLNNLSKPLTSGSIVCPLMITCYLLSTHSCTNNVCHRALWFSYSPCGRWMLQKCILYWPPDKTSFASACVCGMLWWPSHVTVILCRPYISTAKHGSPENLMNLFVFEFPKLNNNIIVIKRPESNNNT